MKYLLPLAAAALLASGPTAAQTVFTVSSWVPPAHTLSTFNLHADYHRPSDDVDKIDFTHMTEVVRAGARAARILVDGPKPDWKPGGRPAAPAGNRRGNGSTPSRRCAGSWPGCSR
mgnify:CR=1 FL=1